MFSILSTDVVSGIIISMHKACDNDDKYCTLYIIDSAAPAVFLDLLYDKNFKF
jgi:hypothetical protein